MIFFWTEKKDKRTKTDKGGRDTWRQDEIEVEYNREKGRASNRVVRGYYGNVFLKAFLTHLKSF